MSSPLIEIVFVSKNVSRISSLENSSARKIIDAGEFAATIDPNENSVFWIKFKSPTTNHVWNHAGVIQELARTVRLAFIVVKEDAGERCS